MMKKLPAIFIAFIAFNLHGPVPDTDSLILRSEQVKGREKVLLLSDINI